LSNAQNEILIVAAYFFPPAKLLRLLKEKAEKGVKVMLVFTAHSDVPFIKPAMEYFYATLSRSGVEIREWQGSILHAKVAFVDDNWITLGSYNLNQLSDFGSLEANLAFMEPKLVKAIRTEFNEKIYPNTERIEKPGTTIPHQLGRFLSFMLIRISLKLLMFTNRYPR
jgi:cardiolipin synthase